MLQSEILCDLLGTLRGRIGADTADMESAITNAAAGLNHLPGYPILKDVRLSCGSDALGLVPNDS